MQDYKLYINLQLFADSETGEKTEPATPRRREEAQRKGQVYKSTDLNAAIIMLIGSVVIYLLFPMILDTLSAFAKTYLLERTRSELDVAQMRAILFEALLLAARVILPIMLVAFVTALVVLYMQIGFVFSSESLNPQLNRLNPLNGFKRIFSKRALVELLKSLLKVIITGVIVYTVMRKHFYVYPRLIEMELAQALRLVSMILIEMAVKVGVVFVIIGVLDLIYQRYEHEESLKMSKYDVKQEYKQVEGDPQIKSKQRQIQREAARRRMMAEVPKADVVITNPTHFAVALKYEFGVMEAPVVTARGQDWIALQIKKIAEENDVTIVENPILARTLYYATDIGDMVPEEFFQAVAEILAFVYKQKKIVI